MMTSFDLQIGSKALAPLEEAQELFDELDDQAEPEVIAVTIWNT